MSHEAGRVRGMGLQDIEDCAAIMAGHPLWQRYRLGKRRSQDYLAALLDSGHEGLVLENSGELWGMALYNRTTFGGSGYLRILAAAPGKTGQGVGGRILGTLEMVLARQGIPALFLLCADFNTAAQKFYARQGYRRVGILPQWILPDVDEQIYVKKILPFGERGEGL